MALMAASVHRGLWLAVLILAAMWLGLIAGISIGARYFVPADSGLAGGPMALGYGAVGALVAGVIAGGLGVRGTPTSLRGGAVVALLLSIASVAYLVYRVGALRAERTATAGRDQPLPAAGDFRLESRIADEEAMRAYRELRLDAAVWQAEWTSAGAEALTCTATLTAEEATAIGRGVAELEASLATTPDPCAGTAPPATHSIAWRRPDAPEGAGAHLVEGGAECLQRAGPWSSLLTTLHRLPIDATSRARARCH